MSTRVDRRSETLAVERESPVGKPQSAIPPAKPMNSAFLFAVVALAITVIGLLYLIQTAHVASLGYEVTRLERERAAAALENQQLTYTVASYESLPRIEQVAVETLYMQPVDGHIFLVVPLPSWEELPLPAPVSQPEQSLAYRVWERLTGRSTATNTRSGQ
jgi:cell division protein FtsL